jgi:hypothetical protein
MAWEQVLGNNAGSMKGGGTRKLLLHTTEGSTIEGAIGAYRIHNSWPHLTVDCKRRRVVQHLPFTVPARSLRNASGGVETNRQGTILVQIEIVGSAGQPSTIGTASDLEWFGREVVGVVCRQTGIPLDSSVAWTSYPASYGLRAGQRLSGSRWAGYSGILGHQHAPENDHGDPGKLDIARILAAARGGDDVTEAQLDAIVERTAKRVVALINAAYEKPHSTIRSETRELAKLGALDALDVHTAPPEVPDASPPS